MTILLVLAVSKQALPAGNYYCPGAGANNTITTVANENVVDFTKSGNPEMMVVLKNHINLIESMSVEIDGNTIVQLQPKLNLYNNFRLHQYTDYNEYINNSAFRGYAKDDNSWLLTPFNQVSEKGNGIVNNNCKQNKALYDHFYNENINIQNTLSKRNWNGFYDVNNIDPIKNYRVITADTMINYYVAYIPLSDLSDLFTKLPPTRGLNMNILLNLNTNSVVDLIYVANENKQAYAMYVAKSAIKPADFNTPTVPTSMVLSHYSSGINNSNGCTPFIVTQPSIPLQVTKGDYSTGWFLDSVVASKPIAQRLTIGLYYSNVRPSVSDQPSLFTQSHPLKVARLYAPMVDFQA